MLRRRSWRWLRTRIIGLLDVPPAYLTVPTDEGMKLVPVPQTRLGYALNPPGKE